jgi:5-methyltetrahydrofolate--homocysteine methyltransferase
MSRLIDRLRSGRVLLMDGAMGTELIRAGIEPGPEFAMVNVTQPHRVDAVHGAYVAAGAEVVLTNTFQTNPERLPGFLHNFWPASHAAIALARNAAGKEGVVLFDLGPVAVDSRRWVANYTVRLAAREDVDGILVETCSNIAFTARVLKTKGRSDIPRESLPVLMSWTFLRTTSGAIRTVSGTSPEACAKGALRLGVAALGVNCGREIGMGEIVQIVKAYRSVTDLPLFVRPNAGTPKLVDGQWVYPETPESMAAWLPELFKAGVVMVGGCCGTTPAHIAAFRKVVDEWNRTHDFSSQ